LDFFLLLVLVLVLVLETPTTLSIELPAALTHLDALGLARA
jgi:hypothetical protein